MGNWTKKRLYNKDFDPKSHYGSDKGIYKIMVGKNIPYPKKSGKTIYLGKSGNLGKRLDDHINNRTRKPGLQAYLRSNTRVYFSIKRVNKHQRRQAMETDELQKHQKIYGMIPICNLRKEKKRR
jgi:hypothetical protein